MTNLFTRIFCHPWVLPFYPAILLVFIYQDVFIVREAVFTHDSMNWYGNFNYFVLSLARGELPLWDPYSFSGAPFYLNHNIVGALDPTLLVCIPLVWFKVSVLDIYHWHFLARILILYAGAYALFRFVSRNDIGALLGAVIVLYVMSPNSFWQHGSAVMLTYVPWILLFLLQLVSIETPNQSKGILYLGACYLIGLTFNLYLFTYLYVFLSLALFYLMMTKVVTVQHLRDTAISVGLFKGLLGVLVLAVTTGPFFYSVTELLPAIGENFGVTRFLDETASDILIHTAKLSITSASFSAHSSVHNLIGIFFPGADTRFFLNDRLPSHEQFISFGTIPIIMVFVFFKRARSPYKRMFLFLMIYLAFCTYSHWVWQLLLRHYPGASSIREVHNFVGFVVLSWGALTAICFASVFESGAIKQALRFTLLRYLVVLAVAQAVFLYFYLSYIHGQLVEGDHNLDFLDATLNAIVPYGWWWLGSYLLIGLCIVSPPYFRKYLHLPVLGLVLWQLVQFNLSLRPYVIQSGHSMHKGHVHYDREFKYQPLRIPFVPRYSSYWGFLPSLYRIPAAIPTFVNDYMSLGRRAGDFVRLVSAERQRIVSGIGARRFGFFDRYVVASDSENALNIVGRVSVEKLHDILVLEENPVQLLPETKSLERVDLTSMPLDENWVHARSQRMADFYDHVGLVVYENPKVIHSPLTISLPQNHPALEWPWDINHIGYFQVMFGPIKTSLNYLFFRYYPNLSVSSGLGGADLCYSDTPEWTMKHAMPRFYPFLYKHPPYLCDLKRDGDKLLISPEIEGAFVTDDLNNVEEAKEKLIPGFSVVSLDPARVTPDRSPYGRDESTEVLAFGPNQISFKIRNSKAGFFFYADSFSKDWKAWIDGKPTHVFIADFNYKAVFVPTGEHLVHMEFRPWLYIVLMWSFIVLSIPGMALPIMASVVSHRNLSI